MSELKHTLQCAANEIRNLRRRNEILEAQMFVVRVFGGCVLPPEQSGVMRPDPLWMVEDQIKVLQEAEKPV